MHAMLARVKDGRIELVDPVDLPEGTELTVFERDAVGQREGSIDDAPEAVAEWLRWYDSLEPLVFTPEERHRMGEDREARRRWELAHADNRADRLRDLWR